METGRKFFVALAGLVLGLAYAVYCHERGHTISADVLSYAANIVLTFTGGNVVAPLAHGLTAMLQRRATTGRSARVVSPDGTEITAE